MAAKQPPEIFFHVGMGKTGTKYIQYKVFPFFKGIEYIQRTSYNQAMDIIRKGESPRYLISNEFDQQMEREVKKWAAEFPDIHPIIVFRRQDGWIASQYRRFVKNSYTYTFKEFLDLENDGGYFKKKDLEFYKNIELLEKHFTKKPLVLLYDDLKNEPRKFAKRVADFTDSVFDESRMDLARKHTSYNLKQLRVIRWVSQFVDLRKRRVTQNPVLHRLFLIMLSTIRYPILYGALLVPDSWVSKEPIISPEELEGVRKYYEADWEQVLAFAKRNAD